MMGERIKSLIRDRGLTYDDLAREIGISPQAVSEIVNGRTKGATARYALARALGMKVRDLWPLEPDCPEQHLPAAKRTDQV